MRGIMPHGRDQAISPPPAGWPPGRADGKTSRPALWRPANWSMITIEWGINDGSFYGRLCDGPMTAP